MVAGREDDLVARHLRGREEAIVRLPLGVSDVSQENRVGLAWACMTSDGENVARMRASTRAETRSTTWSSKSATREADASSHQDGISAVASFHQSGRCFSSDAFSAGHQSGSSVKDAM